METWYVLDDGSAVDPQDVAPDQKGVLRHKGGKAVAMRGEVPSSRSVDPEAERAKAPPPAKTRDMKPEEPSARTYKTR